MNIIPLFPWKTQDIDRLVAQVTERLKDGNMNRNSAQVIDGLLHYQHSIGKIIDRFPHGLFDTKSMDSLRSIIEDCSVPVNYLTIVQKDLYSNSSGNLITVFDSLRYDLRDYAETENLDQDKRIAFDAHINLDMHLRMISNDIIWRVDEHGKEKDGGKKKAIYQIRRKGKQFAYIIYSPGEVISPGYMIIQ